MEDVSTVIKMALQLLEWRQWVEEVTQALVSNALFYPSITTDGFQEVMRHLIMGSVLVQGGEEVEAAHKGMSSD
jgi:hypothetical protein